MKVIIAVPTQDQIINQYVKGQTGVDVVHEVFFYNNKTINDILPYKADVIVLSQYLKGDGDINLHTLIYLLKAQSNIRILFLCHLQEDDPLLHHLINLGVYDIINAPEIDLRRIADLLVYPNQYQQIAHLHHLSNQLRGKGFSESENHTMERSRKSRLPFSENLLSKGRKLRDLALSRLFPKERDTVLEFLPQNLIADQESPCFEAGATTTEARGVTTTEARAAPDFIPAPAPTIASTQKIASSSKITPVPVIVTISSYPLTPQLHKAIQKTFPQQPSHSLFINTGLMNLSVYPEPLLNLTLSPSGSTAINPLELVASTIDNLSSREAFLKTFFHLLLGQLSRQEATLLMEAIRDTYKRYSPQTQVPLLKVSGSKLTLRFQNSVTSGPLLTNLWQNLRRYSASPHNPIAHRLASQLLPWITDHQGLFNRPTSFSLEDCPALSLDLSTLDQTAKKAATFALLEWYKLSKSDLHHGVIWASISKELAEVPIIIESLRKIPNASTVLIIHTSSQVLSEPGSPLYQLVQSIPTKIFYRIETKEAAALANLAGVTAQELHALALETNHRAMISTSSGNEFLII